MEKRLLKDLASQSYSVMCPISKRVPHVTAANEVAAKAAKASIAANFDRAASAPCASCGWSQKLPSSARNAKAFQVLQLWLIAWIQSQAAQSSPNFRDDRVAAMWMRLGAG